MGKITNALKKATEDRMTRMEKVAQIKERNQMVVRKIGESNIDPNVISYFDPKAVISEQYKILRTNLLSIKKGTPPKTIVITSSIHSEGKTVTSLNLAVSLSQAVNKPKVLLIDSDMRKGRMMKYLGVPSREGFSEYLQGEKEVNDIVFQLEDIPNLSFIASGMVPENPAELLASSRMKTVLQTVEAEFDFVLLDTPPIISVTDSGILGSQTDGVILVVQAGRTQRGIVRRAEELLYQSHTKVLGHVLTNIEYHLPEYIYRYL
jgi:capsular exopolysaccharide synthesis family protein